MIDHRSKMRNDMSDGDIKADVRPSGMRNDLRGGSVGRIVWQIVLAIIVGLIAASVQCGFFSSIRPFGIAPDLCLAVTVACGLLWGVRFGSMVGIASGFFIGAMTTAGVTPDIMIYFAAGIAIGFFKMPEPRPLKDIWRYFAAVTAVAVAKKIIETFWVVLTASSLDFSKLVVDLFLRGVICSVLFSPLAYLPCVAAFLIYRGSIISKRRF